MIDLRKIKKLTPMAKGIGSLILVAALLILGSFAIRFCLGLFMTGEQYILALPGETVSLAQNVSEQDGEIPVTEPAQAQVRRATVLATGDLMMHMPTVRSGAKDGSYNYEYIYSYIKDYVKKADYAVVNLETTLSGTEGRTYTGYPKFNSPDAVASGAASGGFDLMLTGNNHCYDYGTSGLLRTLEVVKAAGLDTLGTYAKADEQKYLVRELGGIKVGMLNYTFADIKDDPSRPTVNDLATDSAAAGLINAFDYDMLDLFYTEVENQIAAMKAAGAEAFVLFIHWGNDYTAKVSDAQKAIAQKMCDLGIHVIAGSHSHVVQTMDLLQSSQDEAHQTVVLYSMGNFLSNQRADNISLSTGQSEDGVLFSFTLANYGDGRVVVESVNLLPTWVLIRGTGDGRTYHILPLDNDVSDWGKTFELSASQESDAKKSYNRTMDTIGAKFQEVTKRLEELAAQRTPEGVPPATEPPVSQKEEPTVPQKEETPITTFPPGVG